MYNNFLEIERAVILAGRKARVVVAGSHDEHVFHSVIRAYKRGLIEPLFIGNKQKTEALLEQSGEDAKAFRCIQKDDADDIANLACALVSSGEADIPMKGIIGTKPFLKAVLEKGHGIVLKDAFLSQLTLFEWNGRFMILSDCAINIAPTYEEKMAIIRNAVKMANKIGMTCPKVAIICPVEIANPKIPSTIDAVKLTEACKQGEITGCLVEGPLALDIAVSEEAAHIKGITSEVAGKADIFIVDNLDAGNIFSKALTFFAGVKTAGITCGTNIPIIMCSRTDSMEDKYHTILATLLQWIT